MKYSQNNEDAIIESYFGATTGHLLSLGENDGQTLSNSRNLILKGWTADLVEPAPRAFAKLMELYNEVKPPYVRMHDVAIGNANGKSRFFESGTLLNQGDTDLVSTLSVNETRRWNGVVDFEEKEVDVITVEELLKRTLKQAFDFISIDCEGFDLDILRQMDLDKLKCRCVCVEFNGHNEHFYFQHVRQFGFKLIHKNGENLIYVK